MCQHNQSNIMNIINLSEKPKGYSQQITDFHKSVSHRRFYAPIQQLLTDNPLLVWCVPVFPNCHSSPLPPFLPTSYLPIPSPSFLLLYCTRLITEKEILIHFFMKLRFLQIYFKQGFSLGSNISCFYYYHYHGCVFIQILGHRHKAYSYHHENVFLWMFCSFK